MAWLILCSEDSPGVNENNDMIGILSGLNNADLAVTGFGHMLFAWSMLPGTLQSKYRQLDMEEEGSERDINQLSSFISLSLKMSCSHCWTQAVKLLQ